MEKLHNAMSRLILKRPFYGSCALRLELVEDNTVPTAYTDGKVIGYNRHFIDKLTRDEIQFVLCHEVLHVVLKHPWRRETRDPSVFNSAADFVINLMCKDDGFTLIPNILCDEKWRGKSTEYIYSMLLKERRDEDESDDGHTKGGASSDDAESGDGESSDNDGSGDDESESNSGSSSENGDGSKKSGAGSPQTDNAKTFGPDDVPTFDQAVKDGIGDVRDCVDDTGKFDEVCERQWETAVTVAVAQEKQRGTMSGNVLAAIDGRNEPHVDWTEALANFLLDSGNRFEPTWSKANRRFIGRGDYLPSIKREGISDLVIAVDTSGSCSDAELKQFCSEALDIAEQFDCDITFIPCDTKIGDIQTFESGEYPDEVSGFKLGGRGGTKFSPVFNWVERNMDDVPTALIYFTDGYAPYPVEPDYPVFWAISTVPNFPYRAAPWGTSVEVVV